MFGRAAGGCTRMNNNALPETHGAGSAFFWTHLSPPEPPKARRFLTPQRPFLRRAAGFRSPPQLTPQRHRVRPVRAGYPRRDSPTHSGPPFPRVILGPRQGPRSQHCHMIVTYERHAEWDKKTCRMHVWVHKELHMPTPRAREPRPEWAGRRKQAGEKHLGGAPGHSRPFRARAHRPE